MHPRWDLTTRALALPALLLLAFALAACNITSEPEYSRRGGGGGGGGGDGGGGGEPIDEPSEALDAGVQNGERDVNPDLTPPPGADAEVVAHDSGPDPGDAGNGDGGIRDADAGPPTEDGGGDGHDAARALDASPPADAGPPGGADA